MKNKLTLVLLVPLLVLMTGVSAYAEDKSDNSSHATRFNRTLSRGMSGDDVRDLQELLKTDRDIYPEGLVTGHFGEHTEDAVRKFQKKHGIEQVGVFGPKTKTRFLSVFSASTTANFFPLGLAKKFIKSESESERDSSDKKVTICHFPPGNGDAPHTLMIGASALKAHLAHGDTLGVCPSGTVTTTDVSAPRVFRISAVASTTSATIFWLTNENTSSRVWYATSTPVLSTPDRLSVSTSTLVTNHATTLSGLATSTLYRYLIVSRDGAGNTATSSENSFVTLP